LQSFYARDRAAPEGWCLTTRIRARTFGSVRSGCPLATRHTASSLLPIRRTAAGSARDRFPYRAGLSARSPMSPCGARRVRTRRIESDCTIHCIGPGLNHSHTLAARLQLVSAYGRESAGRSRPSALDQFPEPPRSGTAHPFPWMPAHSCPHRTHSPPSVLVQCVFFVRGSLRFVRRCSRSRPRTLAGLSRNASIDPHVPTSLSGRNTEHNRCRSPAAAP